MITGEEDHRPEVKILLRAARRRAAADSAWVRGRPLQLLLQRDFAGFEDALADYRERGFVMRSGGD